MASSAALMHTKKCLGVPCEHTETIKSTLPGSVSLIALVVLSNANDFFNYIPFGYVQNGQFTVSRILEHPWILSPSGTALEVLILLNASTKCVPMSRALKAWMYC